MSNQIGGSAALGRGAAGGLGSLWPLLIPAEVIGIAVAAFVRAEWWVFVLLVVALAALWHFVIAKIPGQVRVRTIRHSVPGAIVFSARIDGFEFARSTSGAKPLTSGRARVGGTAVVASATDIQLWRGPIGDPSPARAFPWTTVATISASGRRTELAIVMTDGDSVLFRAMNDRAFLPTYMGGGARKRLIAKLLGLRSAPPGT
jgi:hypothetical protein